MITGIKFSQLLCVIGLMSACGVPESSSSRRQVVGASQGAEDSTCASVKDVSSDLGLLDTKVVSTKGANTNVDDNNCPPPKKTSVAAGNKSGTSGAEIGNSQVTTNSVPVSSNVGSANSGASPLSDNGQSGGLDGLSGLTSGLGGLAGGLGGLNGLTSGLGGLTGGLGGLTGGLGGLTGGLGGLTDSLGGLSGLSGGLGNFGNLGSLFGGGGNQSSSGAGSGSNSTAPSSVSTPTPTNGTVTYSANVSTYLNRACVRCHSYLGNYDGAKRTAGDSLNRMKSGNMPPGGGVSASDLSQFQAWVTDGTPQ